MAEEQKHSTVIAGLRYLRDTDTISAADHDEAVEALTGEWSPWPPGTPHGHKVIANWYHSTFCKLQADQCGWEYEADGASGGYRSTHERMIRSAIGFARGLDPEVLQELRTINDEMSNDDG